MSWWDDFVKGLGNSSNTNANSVNVNPDDFLQYTSWNAPSSATSTPKAAPKVPPKTDPKTTAQRNPYADVGAYNFGWGSAAPPSTQSTTQTVVPKPQTTAPKSTDMWANRTNVPTPPVRPDNLGQSSNSQPSAKDLWEIYNQTGNPADFVRASNASQGMASGGVVEKAKKISKEKSVPCHSGIINMAVGGRTDHIPMNVLEGSYVLPADIVSGLGEGNTLAGSKILDNMFSSGPFGQAIPSAHASPKIPAGANLMPKAKGGAIRKGKKPIPIIAAGGEYVVTPDVVERLGQGDMDKGHQYLDNFVKFVRAHTAKTLQNLPGPRKD